MFFEKGQTRRPVGQDDATQRVPMFMTKCWNVIGKIVGYITVQRRRRSALTGLNDIPQRKPLAGEHFQLILVRIQNTIVP